ncbi:hypothetical protein [Streptomyces sp. NPDC053560]|uniref:hypothetical protein n=1 Tax=Streptomyces sp. NPDC053560 TaxID=3365711 RepID=UPI0037D389BA
MRKGRAPPATVICACALTRPWLVPAALKPGPFHGDGGLAPSVDRVYRSWSRSCPPAPSPRTTSAGSTRRARPSPCSHSRSRRASTAGTPSSSAVIGAALCDAIVFALPLLGTERGRRARTSWTVAAVVAAVLTAGFALAMPHAFSFLTAQSARGIQIESAGSLPFHLAGPALRVARHLGRQGRRTSSSARTSRRSPSRCRR